MSPYYSIVMPLNMRASRILHSAAARATSDSPISPRAAKLRAHLRQLRAPRTAWWQRSFASFPLGLFDCLRSRLMLFPMLCDAATRDPAALRHVSTGNVSHVRSAAKEPEQSSRSGPNTTPRHNTSVAVSAKRRLALHPRVRHGGAELGGDRAPSGRCTHPTGLPASTSWPGVYTAVVFALS